MDDFTKEEWMLLFKIMKIAKSHKTSSLQNNIIAQAGYTKVPDELETVYAKIEAGLNKAYE